MRSTVPMSRAAIAGVLLVGLVAMSGCSWLRKDNSLYTAQTRPLEVPPDLVMAGEGATGEAPVGSVTASQTVSTPKSDSSASAGFNMAEGRDAAFDRIDKALSAIDGVAIVNRAKTLGVFDLTYQDANFLVRVNTAAGGSTVSTLNPRATPASEASADQLLETLKAAVGGQ
ncbi:hypothetical protein [Novilysobacter antarcticus]|uniref:hypothetical protein n=1 Tax=Novilysobacter antarcticus TaxID=2862543 RepID=UPI001C99900E|nr:hypothetical protein [Lysobacter antarcticus]